MSDEFENLNSRIPDFASALAARAAANGGQTAPPGTFDPYKAMIKKKREMDSGDFEPGPITRWPEEDVQALKDYCMKMGIYGFNTKLHPRLVLAQLKKQFGDDFTGVPMEERVPEGYEKMGTRYSEKMPYSEAMRRQLLHG